MTVIPMRKRPGAAAPGRLGIDQASDGTINATIASNHERLQLELRTHRIAERIHELGPRPLGEFLLELIGAYGVPVQRRAELYARLDPLFIKAMGGDRLRPDIEIVPGDIGTDWEGTP